MPVTWAPTVDDLRADVTNLESYLSVELQNGTQANRDGYFQRKIDAAISELQLAAQNAGCPIPANPTVETATLLFEVVLSLAARGANVNVTDDARRGPRLRWAEDLVRNPCRILAPIPVTGGDVGAFVVLTPPGKNPW